MDVFLQMAKDNKQELPEQIQRILEPGVKENLKDQQRHLNRHRNVLQKIEAKKRAIQKDNDQWQAWLQDVKQMVAKQKQKREDNVKKLEEELRALVKQEEDIRLQKDIKENAEEEEASMDLEAAVESLLSEDEKLEEPKPDHKKDEVEKFKAQLEAEYALKCQQMQRDLQLQTQQKYQVELDQSIQEAKVTLGLAALVGPPSGESKPNGEKVAPFGRRARVDSVAPYPKDPVSGQQTMQSRLAATHGYPQEVQSTPEEMSAAMKAETAEE